MKIDYNQDEKTGWNLEVYQLFCTCDQRIRLRVKGKVCKSKTSIDVQPETLAALMNGAENNTELSELTCNITI